MNCGYWQVNTGENLSVTPAEHRRQPLPRNVDTMLKTPAPLGAGSLQKNFGFGMMTAIFFPALSA